MSPRIAKVSSPVTLSGDVTPVVPHLGVTLLRLEHGHWRTAGHASVNATGHWSLVTKAPATPGVVSLRVVRVATGMVRTAASRTVRVSVVRSGFTVHATATPSVASGQPIVVSGTVAPMATGSVSLERQLAGHWTRLASAALKKSSFSVSALRAPGRYVLRVSKKATSHVAAGSSASFTVTVAAPSLPQPPPATTTTPPPAALTILTSALPQGTLRAAYYAGLGASGGSVPYTWSIPSGRLPTGLVLSAAGSVSGAPTSVGTSSFEVAVKDAKGRTARRTATITVVNQGRDLQVWGSNFFGALGDGTATADLLPRQVQGLTHVVQVAQYAGTRYALTSSGSVFAWGEGTNGQLGNGTSDDSATPVQVTGLDSGVKSIAAGPNDGYALKTDGTVWAWGRGGDGQLGNGSDIDSPVPVKVKDLSEVTAIAGEGTAALALTSDGTVWTWGLQWRTVDSAHDVTTGPSSMTPMRVGGLTDLRVTAIAGGEGTGYALMADHSVRAWGYGGDGELGNASISNSDTATAVSGLTVGVSAIAAGIEDGYALKSDGTVWSWGQDLYGELGNGDTYGQNSAVPVKVSGLTGAVAISAAAQSAYATLPDGSLRGWGNNSNGQMGNDTQGNMNTTTNAFTPVTAQLTSVSSLAGDAVAARTDGSVWQWGSDIFADRDRATPGPVAGLANISAVALGNYGGVAAKSDGTVWTWGENSFGELGYPLGNMASDQAQQLTSLADVVDVAASGGTDFAIKADGTLWGWGYNGGDELGTNAIVESPPVEIPGITDVIAVANPYVLRSDGTVWRLGAIKPAPGSSDQTTLPEQVTGLSAITLLTAGFNDWFAVAADGTVWAWGDNQFGQLGDGSTTNVAAPEKVPALTGVTSIASGGAAGYAVRDGKVLAWGINDDGELGQGSASGSWNTVPTAVPGITDAVAVAGGQATGYALLASGHVMAWGDGGDGEMGDGTLQSRYSPGFVPGLTGVTSLTASWYDVAALATP